MNIEFEMRKLKEQVSLQSQVMQHLMLLLLRLIADSADKERLLRQLASEKETPAGQKLAPFLDRMIEAVRAG